MKKERSFRTGGKRSKSAQKNSSFGLLLLLFLGTIGTSLLWLDVHPAAAQMAEADVLVAEAILAYDATRYDAALKLLNRALELDQTNVRALYYQGLIHLNLKQPQRAIDPLAAAATLRPNDEDIQYQLGVAYFTLGQYDKASPYLEQAFSQRPDLVNLAYYVGYLRFLQKDYQRALDAFALVQTTDQDLIQLVSFYRGMCLGSLGLSDQAIAQLGQAQSMNPTALLVGPALRIRDALVSQRNQQKRLRASVSLGGFYDDNVSINPDKSGDPLAELLRTRRASSPGLVASAFADYSFYREGPMEATATYSFFQTANTSHGLDQFNIQNHQAGLSGFYRGTTFNNMPFQLALQYTYDYLFLDSRGFLSRNVVALSPTVVEPTMTVPLIGPVANTTTFQFRYQDQNFLQETGANDPRFGSNSRDGLNALVGFVHLLRYSNDDVILRLGYQFDNENTKGATFDYSGNRFLTGGQVKLPWREITMRYDYDVHWRSYKNAQVFLLDDAGLLAQRSDIQQTHLAQLITPLPWNMSWTLQYLHLRNDSNIPVFQFTKNVFTSLLTWTY